MKKGRPPGGGKIVWSTGVGFNGCRHSRGGERGVGQGKEEFIEMVSGHSSKRGFLLKSRKFKDKES